MNMDSNSNIVFIIWEDSKKKISIVSNQQQQISIESNDLTKNKNKNQK